MRDRGVAIRRTHGSELQVSAQIVQDLVMVAREVESKNALLRLEDQPPSQAGPAFVEALSQLSDGKPDVQMGISETVPHEP